ncbi:hypothetical protein CC1_06730 [Coprococcus catus GD/7]|uniref:Uncharacterized protein n=1 Tax=Coprococcus catus GD/7 TaxID=717962 RepID=D4J5E1_9FIRM|nr:hypothetical protein CC1_06730 [Coprococcus catus GD/7]
MEVMLSKRNQREAFNHFSMKRMGVALMVCRFLSWRINGRLIMSR